MSAAPGPFPSMQRRPRAAAFTLLEVLVSLGIIIGALAGIAALLPAAGSRLADATTIDRAGTMAANARADLATRGMITQSLWTGVSTRAIVFGDGLSSGGASTVPHSSIGPANDTVVRSRIDRTTGFQLRDVVTTRSTGTAVITGTGYEPRVCFGCMLSVPDGSPAPPAAGAAVRMTTVVFDKTTPAVMSIALQQTGTGATVLMSGSGSAAAADRRRFLQGCSWVLAVGSREPRWVQVASSWTAFGPGQTTGSGTGASFVSLSGTEWFGLLSGTTLQVFAFEGLLRLDERFVNLE